MKQAGFTHIGTQDGTAILQRDFAGFKSCTVDVSTLKTVNVVSTIGVIFPVCEDWSSLERDYEHLKSMLVRPEWSLNKCFFSKKLGLGSI